jgi:hypothetical protein
MPPRQFVPAPLLVLLVTLLLRAPLTESLTPRRKSSQSDATPTPARAGRAPRGASPTPTPSPTPSFSSTPTPKSGGAAGPSVGECVFSDETRAAIRDLFRSAEAEEGGGGSGVDRAAAILLTCAQETVGAAVSSLGEAGSTVAGGFVGSMAGAAAGSAAAGAFAETFLGKEWRDSFATIGGITGGLVGTLAGAFAGNAVARTFTAQDFLSPTGGLEGTLGQCRALLGVTRRSTAAEVRVAYKAAARLAHPDRGGTQEAMVRLNFCKEALLAVAPKGAAAEAG